MKKQLELLTSILGIGKATAMTLLIEIPELGMLNLFGLHSPPLAA